MKKEHLINNIIKVLNPPKCVVKDIREHCSLRTVEFLYKRLEELKRLRKS